MGEGWTGGTEKERQQLVLVAVSKRCLLLIVVRLRGEHTAA